VDLRRGIDGRRLELTPAEMDIARRMGMTPELALEDINNAEKAEQAFVGRENQGINQQQSIGARQRQREQIRQRRNPALLAEQREAILRMRLEEAQAQGLVQTAEEAEQFIKSQRAEMNQLLSQAGRGLGPENDVIHELDRGIVDKQKNQLVRGVEADIVGEFQDDVQNAGGFNNAVAKGGIKDAAQAIEDQDRAALNRFERANEPVIQFGDTGRPDLRTLKGQAEFVQMLQQQNPGMDQASARVRMINQFIDQGLFDPIGEKQKQVDFKLFGDNPNRPYREGENKARAGRLGKPKQGPDGENFFRWVRAADSAQPKDALGNFDPKQPEVGQWVPTEYKGRDGRRLIDNAARMAQPMGVNAGEFVDPLQALKQAIYEGKLSEDAPLEFANRFLGFDVEGNMLPQEATKTGKRFGIAPRAEGRQLLVRDLIDRMEGATPADEVAREKALARDMAMRDERLAAGVFRQEDIDEQVRRGQRMEAAGRDPIQFGGEINKNDARTPVRRVMNGNGIDPLTSANAAIADAAQGRLVERGSSAEDALVEGLAKRRRGVYVDAAKSAQELLLENNQPNRDVDGYIRDAKAMHRKANGVEMIVDPRPNQGVNRYAQRMDGIEGGESFFADPRDPSKPVGLAVDLPNAPVDISDLDIPQQRGAVKWVAEALNNPFDTAINPDFRLQGVMEPIKAFEQKLVDKGVVLDAPIRNIQQLEAAAMQFAQNNGMQMNFYDEKGVLQGANEEVVKDVMAKLGVRGREANELARAFYLNEMAVQGTRNRAAKDRFVAGGDFLKPEAEVRERVQNEVGIQAIDRENVPRGRYELEQAKGQVLAKAEAEKGAPLTPKEIKGLDKEIKRFQGEVVGPVRELAPALRQLDPRARVMGARDELLEAIKNPAQFPIAQDNELLPFLREIEVDLTSTEGRRRLEDDVKGLANLKLGEILDDNREWLGQAQGRLIGAAEGDMGGGGRRAVDGMIAVDPRMEMAPGIKRNFAAGFRRGLPDDFDPKQPLKVNPAFPVDMFGQADAGNGSRPRFVMADEVQARQGKPIAGMSVKQLIARENDLRQFAQDVGKQQPVGRGGLLGGAMRDAGGGLVLRQDPVFGGRADFVNDQGAIRRGAIPGSFVRQGDDPVLGDVLRREAEQIRLGGGFEAIAGRPGDFRALGNRGDLARNFEARANQAASPSASMFGIEREARLATTPRSPMLGTPSPSMQGQGFKREAVPPFNGQLLQLPQTHLTSPRTNNDQLVRALAGPPQFGPQMAPPQQGTAISNTPSAPVPAPLDRQAMLNAAPQGLPPGFGAPASNARFRGEVIREPGIQEGPRVPTPAEMEKAQNMMKAAAGSNSAQNRVDAPTPSSVVDQSANQQIKQQAADRKGENAFGTAPSNSGRATQFSREMMNRKLRNRSQRERARNFIGGAAAAIGGSFAAGNAIGSAISNERDKREEEAAMSYR